MNLDKCIGCHTCSVTCKQAWTNRAGTEYVWFNNVRKPARARLSAYLRGPGAVARRVDPRPQGRLRLRDGGRLRKLTRIFANPKLPSIDDYYEPWTYDYENLTTAPLGEHMPVAPPRSLISGKPMKVSWSANWDDDLGGSPEILPGDPILKKVSETGPAAARRDLHVLPAADLRTLPEPVVRGIMPVGCDVQALRGRHRARRPGPLPWLADVRVRMPVQEGVFQPQDRQGREVHAVLPADRGRPAHGVLGNLCRAAALSRAGPLRRGPGARRGLGRERHRPVRGAAPDPARPDRPGGHRRARAPRASPTSGSKRRSVRRCGR